MVIETLPEIVAVATATVIICFVSGFVPIINSELYLISVSLLVPWQALAPLVVLATVGAVAAKVVMFSLATHVDRVPNKRWLEAIEKWRRRVSEWRASPATLIFVSSSVGLPPLYVVSILAGALGVRMRMFVLMSFAGRLVRFAICLCSPQLFLEVF